MTRAEFEEAIEDWYDLIDYCGSVGCDICNDIFDSSERDEFINEWVENSESDWEEIRDILNEIPTGYVFYCRGYSDTDWGPIYDDDFDNYKEEVCDWAEEYEYFEPDRDDEDDEEIDDHYYYGENDPEEDLDDEPDIDAENTEMLYDLFKESSDISDSYEPAEEEKEAKRKEAEEALSRFLDDLYGHDEEREMEESNEIENLDLLFSVTA